MYFIVDNVLAKLVPKSGQVKAALELQSCSDADRPRGVKRDLLEIKNSPVEEKRRSSSGEADLLPSLKPLEGTELRLTPFPERNFPEGSSPSEITQHSLDLTYVFETVLGHYSRYIYTIFFF